MTPVQDPPRSGGGGSRGAADGGGLPNLRRPEVYAARRARREMSLPEVMLWQRLKGAPGGLRFRRQHPIGAYRADFYCAAARLVVEVDGIAHEMGERPGRDVARTRAIEASGYRVLRVPAGDVLKDVDAVAQAIAAATARPLRQPLRDCHLPVNGED